MSQILSTGSGGGGGAVDSVTGTSNQVTASPTTGAVVVSTPSTFIAPGSIASTTTLSAGGQFLAENGTSAAPGISFTSNTGIGFALSGSTLVFWIATGQVFSASASDFQVYAKLDCNGAIFMNEAVCASITTPGSYPYTTVFNDYCVLVDTSSARTIDLFASPVQGEILFIKDNVGSAAVNNITISGNGKNIDGSSTYVINTNYGSIQLIYNGTQWNIL